MKKLLQAFYFDHKAYARHRKLKAKANQTKPCSAPQSSYSMDKTTRKKKKSYTEREDTTEKRKARYLKIRKMVICNVQQINISHQNKAHNI